MDIMIDLETLGTKADSHVISIGACAFDIEYERITNVFYGVLDYADQQKLGRTIDFQTVKWWLSQSDEAKKVFDSKPSVSEGVFGSALSTFEVRYSSSVLLQFIEWVESIEDRTVWGNGSTFDISIMENLLHAFDTRVPWRYTKVNDLRTFVRFLGKGKKVEKLGITHNALDDAISQAQYVINALKKPF